MNCTASPKTGADHDMVPRKVLSGPQQTRTEVCDMATVLVKTAVSVSHQLVAHLCGDFNFKPSARPLLLAQTRLIDQFLATKKKTRNAWRDRRHRVLAMNIFVLFLIDLWSRKPQILQRGF